MEIPQQAYWAVIPAVIRRDDRLPANAKLLYGDLSALTNETGYCYAQNEYLMGLYGWSDRTIQRLLAALETQGYIRIEQIPGKERRIFCGMSVTQKTPDKIVGRGRQKCRGTPDKIVVCNKDDRYIDNNTPLTPQGESSSRYQPRWFDAFWAKYPRKADKVKAIRAWDKLQPNLELCQKMAAALEAQKQSPQWQKGKQYIPLPSTWLNGRRWEDEFPEGESMRPAESGGMVEDRGLQKW